MKKYLCVGCYNEYDNRAEAETCCGEEAEEIEDKETGEAEENEEETENQTELTE